MASEQYIWAIWSLILIAIWFVIYAMLRSRHHRRKMLIVSFWSSFFGLIEPFFVPEYWNPPSLFDLARRTGFDIESLVFTFGIAGIASVIYELIFSTTSVTMRMQERHHRRHRFHVVALLSAPVLFFILAILHPFNPIYSMYIAAAVGTTLTLYCRPDLISKMIVSGLLFTALYTVYFFTLLMIAPDYVIRVWNLSAISGILLLGIPLEEYVFAFCVGLLWSSVYEHARWQKIKRS